MSLTTLLVQGAAPANEVTDETGLKIDSMEIDAKRSWIYKKDGGTRQTVYMRGEDPMLSFAFKGKPIRTSGALAGLAAIHPGTAQTLANVPAAAVFFGFTMPTGVQVIAKDLKATKTDTAEDEYNIPAEFWPAITTYSSAVS